MLRNRSGKGKRGPRSDLGFAGAVSTARRGRSESGQVGSRSVGAPQGDGSASFGPLSWSVPEDQPEMMAI
jgi:hypothetical protein